MYDSSHNMIPAPSGSLWSIINYHYSSLNGDKSFTPNTVFLFIPSIVSVFNRGQAVHILFEVTDASSIFCPPFAFWYRPPSYEKRNLLSRQKPRKIVMVDWFCVVGGQWPLNEINYSILNNFILKLQSWNVWVSDTNHILYLSVNTHWSVHDFQIQRYTFKIRLHRHYCMCMYEVQYLRTRFNPFWRVTHSTLGRMHQLILLVAIHTHIKNNQNGGSIESAFIVSAPDIAIGLYPYQAGSSTAASASAIKELRCWWSLTFMCEQREERYKERYDMQRTVRMGYFECWASDEMMTQISAPRNRIVPWCTKENLMVPSPFVLSFRSTSLYPSWPPFVRLRRNMFSAILCPCCVVVITMAPKWTGSGIYSGVFVLQTSSLFKALCRVDGLLEEINADESTTMNDIGR